MVVVVVFRVLNFLDRGSKAGARKFSGNIKLFLFYMNDGLLTGQAFSHTLSDTNMPSDKTYSFT